MRQNACSATHVVLSVNIGKKLEDTGSSYVRSPAGMFWLDLKELRIQSNQKCWFNNKL